VIAALPLAAGATHQYRARYRRGTQAYRGDRPEFARFHRHAEQVAPRPSGAARDCSPKRISCSLPSSARPMGWCSARPPPTGYRPSRQALAAYRASCATGSPALSAPRDERRRVRPHDAGDLRRSPTIRGDWRSAAMTRTRAGSTWRAFGDRCAEIMEAARTSA